MHYNPQDLQIPKDYTEDSKETTSQTPQVSLPLQEPPKKKQIPINNKLKYIQLRNNLPIYVLPAYYSFTSPYSSKNIPVEMKFQVSFRVIFLEKLICKYCSFDFSYTQTQWFQIYNNADSKPMRDIDFSPGFNFNFIKPLPLFGGYITLLRFGYLHLSNGERANNLDVGNYDIRNQGLQVDSPDWFGRSKSIDRLVAQADWQRGGFGISLRAWVAINNFILDDAFDNQRLTNYIGFGDIMLSYQHKKHLIELYINNIFNNYFTKDYWVKWKGRIELGYTYSLGKRVGIYFQLINGFGDSMYEYNLKLTRAGAGLRLNF